MKALTKYVHVLLPYVYGLTMAFVLAGTILFLLGESPWVLAQAISQVLFSPFGLGYTLFYATPLMLTGLSVAVAFHCGLFNIGAEGQLYMGSLGVVAAYFLFPHLGVPFSTVTALAFSFAMGAFWGLIPGFFKATKGSHEVIVTILLNFIGIAMVDYFILYPFRNRLSQNPETFLAPRNYNIPRLSDFFSAFQSTPVNLCLLGAIALCILIYLLLFKTTFGFELRVVGQSERAALFSGISRKKNIILSMVLSGGLAGLVGVNEVMGHQQKLIQGFSPGYGFTGIAVSLLSNNNPLGIIVSSLLFGAIHNSSRELEFLSDRVSKELAMVIQSILIIFIVAPRFIPMGKIFRKLRKQHD